MEGQHINDNFPYTMWWDHTMQGLYEAVLGRYRYPRKLKKKIRKWPEDRAVAHIQKFVKTRINKLTSPEITKRLYEIRIK